jgi:DNA (cytosine-5)-methyltransferase 1
VLRSRDDFLTARQIADLAVGAGSMGLNLTAVLGRLRHLGQDFELEVADSRDGAAYRLGGFKAFLGQPEHARHLRFAARRTTIS